MGRLRKSLENRQCPQYFIPEYNLFDHTMNDARVKEVLHILTDLKDKSILGRWFMENYIIKALCDSEVLPAHRKHLNLTKTNYKLSMQSNDYRCLVELFKQYLCVHRINLTEFQCLQFKACCMTKDFKLPIRSFFKRAKTVEMVHSV